MATTAPSTNPLADSMTKVTGIDPLSTTAGTANPINYDPDMAFRAPESDIIQISGDPGTGATTAETWSHELSLEQLQQDQLEFEYAQQQDLLDQAAQQQQYQLDVASGALAKQSQAAQESQWASTFGIQQAEEARAAALAPYQTDAARIANEMAQYDLSVKANEAAAAQKVLDSYNAIGAQMAWQAGTPISRQSVDAWKAQQAGTQPKTSAYQPKFGTPGYKGQQSVSGVVW